MLRLQENHNGERAMGLVDLSDIPGNPGRNPRRPLTAWEIEIQCRVKALYDNGPFTQTQLSELTGIDQSHLSKMLKGKLPFTKKHIELIAKIYQSNPRELMFDKAEVAICAELSAKDGFHYPLSESQEATLGVTTLPEEVSAGDNNIYCLRMGRDFQPLFPANALLFCEQGTGSQIHDGQWGIFVDDSGRGNLRRVVYNGGDNIILESIIPGLIKSQTKPKAFLRSMDRVIFIKFS